MKASRFNFLAGLLIFTFCSISGQTYEKLPVKGLEKITATSGISAPVTVKVIYDNYVSREGTKPDWGYAILIEGLDKEILFDTGAKPDILESNIRAMKIDPSLIDILVFSHEHGDHTAGVTSFVKMKTGIPVIMPQSFSRGFQKKMAGSGLKPLLVDAPSSICSDLYTSGEFDYSIPEHALVLDTRKGLVVITGCSHPGIIAMLTKIKADFNKNIYMVFGGFHLLDKSEKEMQSIIAEMQKLGVVKCGATHCTGEKQTAMIRESFGNNFILLGTGNQVVID